MQRPILSPFSSTSDPSQMLLNSFINHSVITLKVVEEQVEEEEEDGEMVAVELKLSPRHSVSQSVSHFVIGLSIDFWEKNFQSISRFVEIDKRKSIRQQTNKQNIETKHNIVCAQIKLQQGTTRQSGGSKKCIWW